MNRHKLNRRSFLTAAGGLFGVGALGTAAVLMNGTSSVAVASSGEGAFEITLTDDEWRARLTPEQFNILRQHGTEWSWTSKLNEEKREGSYHCAGCNLAAYPSSTKFESGTGWPSFWQPYDNAVETQEDRSLFAVRTEVHCRRCGGHHGHVFTDGPAPTGLRYCINGLALTFKAA